MTLRVLLITQWYPPEPVDIPESIALALVEHGLEVAVLTGVPNYPHGKVPKGYSSFRASAESIRSIRVQRTPLYPSHDSQALKRLVNYASWALSSAVFGQHCVRRSDVSLVYSSPATAALSAMVGKLLWGKPYVLLVQDVWPDSIFASGFVSGRMAEPVRRLVAAFVQRSYSMAAHVAVISPGMADLLADRGVPPQKLSVVFNWLPDIAPDQPDRHSAPALHDALDLPPDVRVFMYAGNHGHAQALEPLVDAFAMEDSGTAHLVMLGSGVTKSTLVERAAGNPRVHFLEPVTRDAADRLMSSADATVVSLSNQPLFAVTMPSKVQSGLRAGLPMLVVARGDAADVVETAGAGVAAAPGDAGSIADAVLRLSTMSQPALSAMGHAGSMVYESMMSKSVGAPRLADILSAAADRGGRRRRRTCMKANEGNVA